jgi:ADP-heptose:LPS heptosyltransferase
MDHLNNRTLFPVIDLMTKEIHRILVIRCGALGDTIQLLPVLATLRQEFPQAYIEALGYPERLSIAVDSGYIDKTSSFETKGMHGLFFKKAAYSPQLKDFLSQFDLIISYESNPENTFTANLRRCTSARIIAHSPFPQGNGEVHVVTHLLKALEPLKINPQIRVPRVHVTTEAREWAKSFLECRGWRARDDVSLIAIHPGSGSLRKCWPEANFLRVCHYLLEAYKAKILLVLGAAEKHLETELLDETEAIKPIIAKNLPLSHLAAILQMADLYIGNDSGVTHLAAAVGCPTLAVFGPSNPEVWKPLGTSVKVLYSSVECSPCTMIQRVKCTEQKCLTLIEPEAVVKKTASFLDD